MASFLRVFFAKLQDIIDRVDEHNATPGAHGLPTDITVLETKAGAQQRADAAEDAANTFATAKKGEAIAAAASDATTKANAAQTAAEAEAAALIAQHDGDPSAHNLPPVEEIATLADLDGVSAGISAYKDFVDCATTGNTTLSGLQTIDGFVGVDGTMVLVKDQTNAAQNGIYEQHSGSWTRRADFDADGDVSENSYIPVLNQGTPDTDTSVNGGTAWVMITGEPQTIGTTPLTFRYYGRPGSVNVSAPLTRTGNTIGVQDEGIGLSKLAAILKGGVASVFALRKLDGSPGSALPYDHPSTTNSRNPTTHASSHGSTGSDPIDPASLNIQSADVDFPATTDINANNVETAIKAVRSFAGTVASALTTLAGRVTAAETNIAEHETDIAALTSALSPDTTTGLSWEITFQDDKSGTSFDTSIYSLYSGTGNEGIGTRSPAACRLVNGEEQILGNGDVGGGIWYDKPQIYGRYEIRYKCDAGAGYGPAVMLWPYNDNWPDEIEIDIIEAPEGAKNKCHTTLHKVGNQTIDKTIDIDLTQWHVFVVEWLSDRLSFYVDGVKYWEVTDPSYIPTTQHVFVHQLDVGGFKPNGERGWIDPRTPQAPQPVISHLDYFKMWKPVATTSPTSKLTVIEGGAVKNFAGDALPAGTDSSDWSEADVYLGDGNAFWMKRRSAMELPDAGSVTVDAQRRTDITSHVDEFFAEFVRADGAVLQKQSDNQIISQGIAGALEMAVLTRNQARYDKVTEFAETKMLRSLPAANRTTATSLLVKSLSAATGTITDADWNPQSELERMVAHWRAYKLWGRAADRIRPTAIANDIENNAVMYDGTRAYLVNGETHKNRTNGQGYNIWESSVASFHWVAFKVGKALTGRAVWDDLGEGGWDILTKQTDTGGGLPTPGGLPANFTDYNTQTHDVGQIAVGQRGWSYAKDTLYGYTAFPTIAHVWQAWKYLNEPRALAFLQGAFKTKMTALWAATPNGIPSVLNHDGTVNDAFQSNIFTWAAWLALTADDATNTTAAAMRASKVRFAMVTNPTFGKYFPNVSGGASSYYANLWNFRYESIDSGLDAELFLGLTSSSTGTGGASEQFVIQTAATAVATHNNANGAHRRFLGNEIGPPTSGTWQLFDEWVDLTGRLYRCTAPGTPGTWFTEPRFVLLFPNQTRPEHPVYGDMNLRLK